MSGRGGNRGGGRSSNRGGGRRGGGNDSYRGGGGRSHRDGGGRGRGGGGYPKPSLNPCSAFTTGGNCPQGDHCKFSHGVKLYKVFPASSPKAQKSSYNSYNNQNNNPPMYPIKAVAIWENQGAIQIFTGAEDGFWRLWNTANMSFNQVADKNMNGSVECLKVVANYLFCGFSGPCPGVPDGQPGQVNAWNLANPNEEMKLHMSPQPPFQYAHNLTVTALEVVDNQGSPRIISGSEDGTIRIWTSANNTFALEKTLPGHAGKVTGLCAIPGGKHLWSSSTDGTLRIWDLSQPEATAFQHCISRETPAPNNPQQGGGLGHSDAVTALLPFAMNAGTFVISGSMDGSIKVWDSTTGNCMASESHGEGVVSMSVGTTQAGGQVLLIGLASGNIAVRNILQTSKYPAFNLLYNLSGKYTAGHSGPVNTITAGPAATFYTGGKDGNVMVWQLCGDLGLQ
eukprot:scaffold5828_cov168-Amphora_coffeaeformis.AAC.2